MAVSYFEPGYGTAEDLKPASSALWYSGMYSVTSAIIKYFGVEPLVVFSPLDAGLRFAPPCYETGQLGAPPAAPAKYSGPFVVLDFALPPPLMQWVGRLMHGRHHWSRLTGQPDALVSRNCHAAPGGAAMPQTVLGRNTVEQIQAGVVAGYMGNYGISDSSGDGGNVGDLGLPGRPLQNQYRGCHAHGRVDRS